MPRRREGTCVESRAKNSAWSLGIGSGNTPSCNPYLGYNAVLIHFPSLAALEVVGKAPASRAHDRAEVATRPRSAFDEQRVCAYLLSCSSSALTGL